jgi:glycosyltransferase involved in cell wall biosynthesis
MVFSVIIPTYNRADKLRKCLDSLVNQTFKELEVLVCDDGSTDDTAVVAGVYGKSLEIRDLHMDKFGGPARPRNTGGRAARAPWVCFLDSDDRWYPGKLEACRPYLADYDLICHDFDIDFDGVRLKRAYTPEYGAPIFTELMVKGRRIFRRQGIDRGGRF